MKFVSKLKKNKPNVKNFQSEKLQTPNHNPLEMHPVLKELTFLYQNKIYLNPIGDRFNIQSVTEKRGGEIYQKPCGWVRYALKVKICYPSIDTWLTSDGSPNEWAVAYHGFKISPLRCLKTKLMQNGKLNPFLANSKNTKFVNVEDVNPRSLRHKEKCNIGIFCSPSVDEAEKNTCEFKLNDKSYKMLLQCRVNPRRIRKPKGTDNLYIINNSSNIRPYGILIKDL